jgi:hypothetical protein
VVFEICAGGSDLAVRATVIWWSLAIVVAEQRAEIGAAAKQPCTGIPALHHQFLTIKRPHASDPPSQAFLSLNSSNQESFKTKLVAVR